MEPTERRLPACVFKLTAGWQPALHESSFNRNLIQEKIFKLYGKAAWGLARHGYQKWFDIADGRTREEERNEK